MSEPRYSIFDLETFRGKLSLRRKEILSELQDRGALEVERTSDEIERIQNAQFRDSMGGRFSKLSDELKEINSAVGRLDSGVFGECEICGEIIPTSRLKAVPSTRYCVRDAERIEKSS